MKGKIMSKLVYTTALSLLTSCAMAMDPTADEARLIQANSEQIISDGERCATPSSLADETMHANLGSAEYLDSSNLGDEARQIYSEKKDDRKHKKLLKKVNRHFSTTATSIVNEIAEKGLAGNRPKVKTLLSKFTGVLDSLHYKEMRKSKSKIRQKNRYIKDLICRAIEEATDSSDDDVSISKCDELSTDTIHNLTVQAKTAALLRDFALSNLSGRGSTYAWTDEENTTYIHECFNMLWNVYNEYRGQLPGVAQILLGDIWPIATHQQENEIIGLLNNKQISFSEEDVAALLSTVDSSPLDVLSIENIERNCIKSDPIVLYASLLRPFMQNSITAYLEEEQEDLTKIMKLMDRYLEPLDPQERQEITSKLNIMTIFESDLATKYAENTDYKELVRELSDKIKRGEISTQDAADSLIRQLDYDGTLENEVTTCVGILNGAGFQSYIWKEDAGSEIDSQEEVDDSENGSFSQGSGNDTRSGYETDYSDVAEVEL